MPGRTRVPVFVRRCVRAVGAQDGDTSRAFAICVAQYQKSGQLKPGSLMPTALGKKLSKKKSSQKGAGAKADEYERLLATSRGESLAVLCRQGRRLLEQEEESEPTDELLSMLDDRVTGDLKVRVTMAVGKASEDTQRAALKLLKRYKENLHGGVGGLSSWTVTKMRARLHPKDATVEFELWLDVKKYKGMEIFSDLVQQISDAALELGRSMIPDDAKRMLGNVTPDKVTAEPLDFVQAA